MLDRSIAPERKELVSFPITKAVSAKLSNGIPIHYIRAGGQDLVKIEIIFNAGNYYEPAKGVSHLTSKMLNEGTTSYTSKELANKIASYGAFIEFLPGNDKLSIVLTTLTKYVCFLLPVLKEIIQDSIFPEKNFNETKNVLINQLKVNLEKTGYLGSTLFKKSIFGENHPYGYIITEQLINDISLQQVINYYNSNIKENSYVVVISGKVNETLTKEIDLILGQEKTKYASGITITREAIGEGKPQQYFEKQESLQSTIKIGRKLFNRNHPDYVKFLVLNEALGGYFGSRLMKNLREEKGLTYGISSQIVSFLQEGYFVISTDVKKEDVKLAVKEIYTEIEILKSSEIDNSELTTIKNYMIGGYLGSLTTAFQLAEKFKAIHFNNLTYSYYDSYIENIKKTTSKEIKQLSQKYFDKINLTEVVVG